MQVPHNAFVAVADGRKMLLFRNKGNPMRIDLEVEHRDVQENPGDLEQKTDKAGRASSTQSGPGAPPIAQGGSMHARGQGAQFATSRGTMDEPDYHQQEEDRFAADVAAELNRRALENGFEALVVVAPARTLGELRKHYHKELQARLIGEIDKAVTGLPVARIEEVLAAS